MADVVGEVAVMITAQTEKFEAATRRVAEQTESMGAVVAGVAAGVTNYFLNMGTSAASGLASMAAKSFESINALTELSGRVQASVTDLQALGAAAARSGSSAATVSSAFEKFTKILGGAEESATGGNAAKAVAMLGMSMDDLQANDKAEGMAVIAARMADITDVTQRAFIETSLFGKSGAELDGVMKRLASDGLDGVERAALATGEALSEVDANKVSLAQNKIEELQGTIAGIGNIIAAKVSPAIDFAIDQVLDFINANGGMESVVTTAFKNINSAIGWTLNTVELLKAGWYGFQAVVNEVADSTILGPIRGIATAFDALLTTFKNGINELIDIANSLQNKSLTVAGKLFTGDASLIADTIAGKAGQGEIKHIDASDTGISDTLDKMHDGLQKNAADGVKAYSDHMSKYLSGKGHDDWVKFTDGVANDFTKKAKAAADAAALARQQSAGVMGEDGKAVKSGWALQVDPSKVSVNSLRMAENKVIPVSDPKLDVTNAALDKIVKNTAKGGTATMK